MKQVKAIILRILCPPKWVAATVPLLSFAALVFVFATEKTESMLTYVIYTMSAYSLALICGAVYCGVIFIAIYMLMRSRKYWETVKLDEQK